MLNLSAVTDDLDIVTKEYVDAHGGGAASVVLYDNVAGNNGNITLTQSAANYNFMRVYFFVKRDSDTCYASTDVCSPDGKTVSLFAVRHATRGTRFNYSGATYLVSGSSMTLVSTGSADNGGGLAGNADTYIYRVEAWSGGASIGSGGGSGGGGGAQIDLLWTNPNPTSNFAAQTLSNIPWQNYKFLLIDHYTAGNGNVAEHYETSVISTANPSVWSWITCIREVPFGRGVKFPASNQVQFGSQTYYSTYNGANATLYDDWPFIVPTKIWGLKDDGGTNPDVDWTQSTYANGYYMRRGKMVSVVCESWGNITAPNNNYATVFTLPEGFRPILPTNKEMYGSCSPLGAAYPVTWKIESDGKVSVGGNGTSPNYWAFSTTFPCE